jgi:hypothetical protein
MKKLFVLRVGDYRPELCRYTIPTIKAWAEQNDWTYQEINERKFPWAPITGEKMQIKDMVDGCEWAMHVDADVMLRPDTPCPADRPKVFSSYEIPNAERLFKGLKKGVSGGYYGAHRNFFGLWEQPQTEEEWAAAVSCCERPHIVDEYLISRNIQIMGAEVDGVCHDVDAHVRHFGSELVVDGADGGVALARDAWYDWQHIWPHLKNYFSP